jgi:hypothetical protein
VYDIGGSTDPGAIAFKSWIEELFNTSYYVPFGCSVPTGGVTYMVTAPNGGSFPLIVNVQYKYVSIGLRTSLGEDGTWLALLEYSGGQLRVFDVSCASVLFDCQPFSGTFPGTSATYSVT